MAGTWGRRNLGWIADDLRRLAQALHEPEMWILLALMALFGVVIYYGFVFALKFDFMMRLRHLGAQACREMGNSPTAFLFFGMAFLALFTILVFGEFAHYLDYKRRKAYAPARRAAWNCAGWGTASLILGVAMVTFMQSQCI